MPMVPPEDLVEVMVVAEQAHQTPECQVKVLLAVQVFLSTMEAARVVEVQARLVTMLQIIMVPTEEQVFLLRSLDLLSLMQAAAADVPTK
jgi:hypothetical protein